MISLLEIAKSINESDDDKYVSIGFGRFKLKGKEDDDSADVFVKTDSGKYVKSADQKSDDDGGKKPEEPQGGKLGGSDFDRDANRVADDEADDMDRDARFAADADDDEVKQAIDSAEKVADKYGIESDIAGNEQGLNRVNIGSGGEYEGDNQLTVSYDDEQYHIGIQGEDAMQGPIGYMSFDSKEEMESALDKILGNEKIKDALKKGDSLEGMKDEIESLGKGGSDDDDREEDPNYLFKQDDDDDEDENKVADANSDVIRSLEDMDLNGLDINSVSSETDEGMYAELMGKDVDEPDNAMTVTAFEEGGKIEYGINVGVGHEVIYFDSKEEALEATQKLAKDDKIRKAMDGEGEETLADLGAHAKSIVKGKDETITINGKQYKPIKESGKTININLKEKYDRIFRSLK